MPHKLIALLVTIALLSGRRVDAQGAAASTSGSRQQMAVVNRILFHGIALKPAQIDSLKDVWRSLRGHQIQQDTRLSTADRNVLRKARAQHDTVTVGRILRKNQLNAEKRRDEQFAAIRQVLMPKQRGQFDRNVRRFKRLESRALERAKHPAATVRTAGR